MVDPRIGMKCRLGETTYNIIVRRISAHRVLRLRLIGLSLRFDGGRISLLPESEMPDAHLAFRSNL